MRMKGGTILLLLATLFSLLRGGTTGWKGKMNVRVNVNVKGDLGGGESKYGERDRHSDGGELEEGEMNGKRGMRNGVDAMR